MHDTDHRLSLVTACDAGMEELAMGLVGSLGPAAGLLTLVDIGLSATGRAWLTAAGVAVVDPPATALSRTAMDRPYFAAMYLRPMLPQFVPGDALMWIDADCWVQDPTVIEDFQAAAARAPNGIAICSMIDPDYDACMANLVQDQEWYRALHARLFDAEAARFLFGRAVFSTGVFCMRRDSPVWGAWADEVRRIYDEVRPEGDLGHMAEQCAMNKVLHAMQGFAVLPSMNNWHCHGATMERVAGQVVVASSRRAPRIVHLSAFRHVEATYRAARLLYEPGDAPHRAADADAQTARLRHDLAFAQLENTALLQRLAALEAGRNTLLWRIFARLVPAPR